MLVFIDLDGTLIDTAHPRWRPYQDGQYPVDVNEIRGLIFPGAVDFLQKCFQRGINVVLVSDSHPRYVEPIRNMLGLEGISLADKPNTQRLDGYIAISPILQQELAHPENCFFIGDTKLDIEIGRKMRIRTILLQLYSLPDPDVDVRSGVGDRMGNLKMGPTYCAYSFGEVLQILNEPDKNLYVLESKFIGLESNREIHFWKKDYSNDIKTAILCLARQEEGLCDAFARSDKYREISNPNRPPEFLDLLAGTLSSYLRFFESTCPPSVRWTHLTYLSDKSSTKPPEKMKQIFDRIQSDIPKARLLTWLEMNQGSLRNQVNYQSRKQFLNDYLRVDDSIDLRGANIIVIDDQLTTSATAHYVIKQFRERGAKNVFFIAFFQMIMEVGDAMICPQCGQKMKIRRRARDGKRFYSCVPPQYGGQGCGNIINID